MVQYQSRITTRYAAGVPNPDPLLEQFAGGMITDMDQLREKLIALGRPSTVSPEDGVLPSSIAAVDPSSRCRRCGRPPLQLTMSSPLHSYEHFS